MKFLKQFIITVSASCVLAVSAMASEPQKNDQKPPPKPPQEVRKPEKPPPPPPSNSNKGNGDGKRGGKP